MYYLSTLISRAFGLVTTGILSQISVIIWTIFLTRHLAPEAFGVYGIYLAYFVTLTMISLMKYDLAILSVTTKRRMNLVMTFCLMHAISVNSIALIICLFLTAMYGFTIVYPLVILSSISASISQVTKTYQSSKGVFNIYKSSLLINATAFILVSFTLIFIIDVPHQNTLVIAHCLGLVVSLLYAIKVVDVNIAGLLRKTPSKRILTLVGRKYSQFPRLTFPSELIMLTPQLLTVLISRKFGVEVTGFYTLCQRMILTPFTLLGLGISEMVRSDISRKRNARLQVKEELVAYVAFIIVLDLSLVLFAKSEAIKLFDAILGPAYFPLKDYFGVLYLGLIGQANVIFTAYLWGISDKKKLGLKVLFISQLLPVAGFFVLTYSFPQSALSLFESLSYIMFAASLAPIVALRRIYA
jgi:O-antigen/teichoic acid export membrane protein